MRSLLRTALVALVAILLVAYILAQLGVSTVVVVIVLALTIAGAAGAIYMTVSQERSKGVRRRVGRFTGADTRDDVDDRHDDDEDKELSVADLIAPEAEIAGMDARLGHILLATLAGGLVLGVVVAVLFGSAWGLLAGLAAPLVTRSIVKRRVAQTRKRFEQQLPDNLDVISSALRVGNSIAGAFAVTVDAAEEPSRTEFGRAVADEQLGVPLDVALMRVADRMKSADVEQIALVTRLQRDAGTNAAEVLDQVAENVRGRLDLVRLVNTLTAQGRMARWIVSLLPILLFVAMYIINREYLAPLWETAVGKVGMCVALVMIATGSLIIKKIVEIEV